VLFRSQKLAKHPIAANQMNYNVLYKDEVDDAFKKYCQANDIKIVAYQPVKRQEVLTNATIQAIAKAHGATPAQIALAWLIAQNTLPIPKAVTQNHIDENIAAINIELSAQELEQLNQL
jgi:diketogulonate reductase-like aldo/keto reductase